MSKHYLRITYTSYNDAFEEFEYLYEYETLDSYESAVNCKEKRIEKDKEFRSCFSYDPSYEIIDRGDILQEEVGNFKNMNLGQFMELIK